MFVILSAPCEPKEKQCLALCWREMRRCGSGHFQGTSTASRMFASRVCPTEGKQMRCNVNSRLLMQHCAKNMRPRSLDGLSV